MEFIIIIIMMILSVYLIIVAKKETKYIKSLEAKLKLSESKLQLLQYAEKRILKMKYNGNDEMYRFLNYKKYDRHVLSDLSQLQKSIDSEIITPPKLKSTEDKIKWMTNNGI